MARGGGAAARVVRFGVRTGGPPGAAGGGEVWQVGAVDGTQRTSFLRRWAADGTLVLDPTATPERDAARALGERGPLPVIGGTESRPTLWFDAELMRGTDPAAQAALDQLARAVLDRQGAVVLESGDCLIVDNTVAVHGRSSYAARFDGTDRWLQRAFVVSDLAPSAADRDGRIIGTLFR
mgnify:CR=1 FL=1